MARNTSSAAKQLSDVELRVSSLEDAVPVEGRSTDLTLAWASDAVSGEPRYILELSESQRGAACGCVCRACGNPLIAVNAGKTTFFRRPHFRHPAGTLKKSCEILAARVAAVRLLRDLGEFELPGRRMWGHYIGLSGQAHRVWVRSAPQRVTLRSVNFRDWAKAVLTLDDGREVLVDLVGTAVMVDGGLEAVVGPEAQHDHRASILIAIDDPAVAGLGPRDLMERLRLLDDTVCWHRHWADAAIAAQAQAQAREAAYEAFDAASDDEQREVGWEQLPPELRRESLLHLTVKHILQESRALMAPAGRIEELMAIGGDRPLLREWTWPAQRLALSDVILECKVGQLIPDLLCSATDTQGQAILPLLIEVTVSNPIDAARKERIRAGGRATLEIDLRLASGRVTRSALAELVIENIEIKRWLLVPGEAEVRVRLHNELVCDRDLDWMGAAELDQERQRLARAPRLPDPLHERRPDGEFDPPVGTNPLTDDLLRERLEQVELNAARLRELPTSQVGEEYLREVLGMAYAIGARTGFGYSHHELGGQAEMKICRATLEVVQRELADRGYPCAVDPALTDRQGILVRLSSIRHGIPYGHRHDTVFQVIRAAMNDAMRGSRVGSDATIYLIAISVYKPAMSQDEAARVATWRGLVRDSIRSGQTHYLRDPRHDDLISLLFPEMEPALRDQRLVKAGPVR